MRLANERRRYYTTSSLIGLAPMQNDPDVVIVRYRCIRRTWGTDVSDNEPLQTGVTRLHETPSNLYPTHFQSPVAPDKLFVGR